MNPAASDVSASYTLAELAEYLDAELVGDGNCVIRSLADIKSAGPDQLSFVASPAYARHLAGSRAGAVILPRELADEFSGNRLLVDDAYRGYARISALFDPRPRPHPGVHPTASVGEGVELGEGCCVGPQAVLGDGVRLAEAVEIGPGCVLGEDCQIGPHSRLAANVTLYHGIQVGARCLIHSGTVIGSDGFGFAPAHPGWLKIHQLGSVVLGDDVEIGANVAIDRGALGDTVLCDGVKLDNLVHIAHNVRIGKNTAIAGNCGIAGSTTVGENCTFAGAVGVNGHIVIGDNVHFTGMSMVTRSVTRPGSYSSGVPASETAEWRKNAVRFRQLNDLASRVKQLEKKDKG